MIGQQYAQFVMRLLECFGGKSGGEEVHKHAKKSKKVWQKFPEQ